MMISLDENNKQNAHHNQKTIPMKELQKMFGEIYLRWGETITTTEFFMILIIRIACKMDAAEFEGLLYTILSEESFKNHRILMK